ncbi:MAG: ABC transporter ATP-binding protein [Halobacteriales archaeon]
MARLTLDSVTKVYDDAQGTERAVDGVDLAVEDGEFVVIVGPSGCGKTTTLRMIAGLETVTEGQIRLDGREVQDLAPVERNVAMAFQNYALYPSMTGRENMSYGLKHAEGMSASKREELVTETAELLEITDVLEDPPDEMSGGQKQRVALGRAIVREPDIFLLDEPLSNLDAKLRAEMRRELQRIHRSLDITTVYVTHDQKEAMTMADKIAVMNDGRLQQFAEPDVAYRQPANRFVGEFLGSPAMNVAGASLTTHGENATVHTGGTDLLTIPTPTDDSGETPSQVVAGFRPEDLTVGGSGDIALDARVTEVEYQGDGNFVFLETEELAPVDVVEGEDEEDDARERTDENARDDAVDLTVRTPVSVRPSPGEAVTLTIDPENVYLFDAKSGDAIEVSRSAPARPTR